MANDPKQLFSDLKPLQGVPCRVNDTLAKGTIRLIDRDKPTVYVEADSMETLRDVVHFANDLMANRAPAPKDTETVEKLLGYPVVISEDVPKHKIRFGPYPDFSKPPYVPEDKA